VDVYRFVPRLEEIETRDTPSVSPADVFSAAAGVEYIAAGLQRYTDRPEVVQSSTTQTHSQAQLTTFASMSDGYVAILDEFLSGLQGQAAGGADVGGLIAQTQAQEDQARADGEFARDLLSYIAVYPAPKANTAVIGADGASVTVFGPAGTPITESASTGTTTTQLPGSTTTTGGVNLGNLLGGTGTNTATTGTGTTSSTTGTDTTGTNTSGTNTGTNSTGSTSGSGSTTDTSGTTSSTATP
jgi:hypothetical protein